MSYTSFLFLLFFVILSGIYFLVPLAWRWLVLLAGSLAFYIISGVLSGAFYLPFLLIAALVGYLSARLLDEIKGKEKKRVRCLIMSLTVILLIGFLCFIKFSKFFLRGGSVLFPLGVSYYTFSVTGYVLDIYWHRYKAETNFLKFLLFVSFFPHIVQGPIARYNRLAPQLAEGHRFEYRRICEGAQLMLWGAFQKLVIADRLKIFVDAVYGTCENQYGLILLAATVFYAIQIYTDFSGCVNLARGMSRVVGVELEENFRQPYFAQSVEEFWRRWHMTLGGWFRDYLGMPVSVSAPVKRWSKAVRKKHGSAAGKHVVSVCALIAVWISTGLWHGTGWNYMLWAAWQGGIIIAGVLLKDHFDKWKKAFHIRETSRAFQLFRMARTFVLVGLIPRVVTRADSLRDAGIIFRNLFRGSGMSQLLAGGLSQYGWGKVHLLVAAGAILVQLAVSILRERGIDILPAISEQKLPVRWFIYYALLFSVLIFGMYGSLYDAANFAYADF